MKSRCAPAGDSARLLLLLSAAFLVFPPYHSWSREITKSSPVPPHTVLPASTAPIWQLDVRALGFTPLEQHYEPGESWFQVNPLAFLGENYTAVTFVTREAPSGLPRRDSPDESLPYHLHAFFIEASSGRLRASREWPTASQSAAVLSATQGNFVVLTPDTLWLYSSNFQLLSERTLSLSSRAHEGWWRFSYSPNGKYLLVMHGVNPRDALGGQAQGGTLYYAYEWIALNDLRLVRSWQEDSRVNLWKGKEDFNVRGGSLGSIFDNQMITRFETGFLVREFDGPFRLVSFSHPVPNIGEFDFLNSQLIAVVCGKPYRPNISLIRTDGEVVFQQTFSDREQLQSLRASSDGRRFALAIYRGKGGNAALDIPAHNVLDRIMVYDVNARQWVYTLGAKSHGIKDLAGLALSPDGYWLALLSDDEQLSLYGLPRPTSGLR